MFLQARPVKIRQNTDCLLRDLHSNDHSGFDSITSKSSQIFKLPGGTGRRVFDAMTDESSTRLEISDGIATLTLARPLAGNALDTAMCRDLENSARKIADSAGVRVVLLRSEGKTFCVGGDVAAMAAAERRGEVLRQMVVPLHNAVRTLVQLDAPLIVAVQGAAAGAGLSLIAAADLVVAARSAKFTMAYTAIGLSPDGGATWSLPRVIGLRRTVELALTNRQLDAVEALEWGLVSHLADDAELDATAMDLAQRLAQGATAAFGTVKRLLQRSYTSDLTAQLDAELEAIVAAAASSDAAEGLGAFSARRKPTFQGY
jgi:2-(1,2-epoxy-1,2-dihydrophenyl)acetyl-CoA isomerase